MLYEHLRLCYYKYIVLLLRHIYEGCLCCCSLLFDIELSLLKILVTYIYYLVAYLCFKERGLSDIIIDSVF